MTQNVTLSTSSHSGSLSKGIPELVFKATLSLLWESHRCNTWILYSAFHGHKDLLNPTHVCYPRVLPTAVLCWVTEVTGRVEADTSGLKGSEFRGRALRRSCDTPWPQRWADGRSCASASPGWGWGGRTPSCIHGQKRLEGGGRVRRD